MIDREPNRRGYLDQFRRWSRPPASAGLRLRLRVEAVLRLVLQVIFIPAVLLTALIMVLYLRLSAPTKRSLFPSSIHDEASAFVADLAKQYPFHLYPLVAKALELAYLKRHFGPSRRGGTERRVVEVAIGEGSLLARLFGDWTQITALDLNPHSLSFAAKLGHVGRAIVCDGIQPPLRAASFDVLLSVNFLHHVTDKKSAVANWGRIARTLVFNDNTPYWASGWTVPQVLKRLGMGGLAARAARRIERQSLQHLVGRSTLDGELGAVCEVAESASFFSERCFFYCSLFSFFMRCYGPPTPALLKRIFLGPLRRIAIPLTKTLALLLLKFDQRQGRETDTFVFYVCRSREPAMDSNDEGLLCPGCRSPLLGTRCEACGASYPVADKMLFLLPKRWAYLFDDYVSAVATPVSAEHL